MLQAAKVVLEKTRRLPEDRRQELEKRLPLAASERRAHEATEGRTSISRKGPATMSL